MNITKLVLGACSTNVYIVSSNKKNAILIDPADNAAEIIKTIEENGLCLKYIFITHGHTDHILALKEVNAGRLEDEELINERPYVKIPYKAVKADILICEDDIVNLDELSFSFLGMPGHTDGSMAIIVNDNIFSGDTIMFEKHGKTSLPGGNEKLLISSIEKMMNTLIGDYKIYPGHRQETSLDYERKCRLSTVITGY